MLQTIKIKMAVHGQAIPSWQWGSLMHGVLMEKLASDYAEFLHSDSGFRPFSQYVLQGSPKSTGDRELIWTLHLMGEEAVREIGHLLQSEQRYYVEHKKTGLKVIEIKADEPVTEEDFCSRFLLAEKPSFRPKISYLTPCSHKSNGQYSQFPSVELIINNLVQKWNTYAKEYALEDEQAVSDMIQHTWIMNYHLRSARYPLEGISIPAYIGELDFSLKGPEPLIRLVNMLFGFAEYSGIGIKASLGMGACYYEGMGSIKEV